MFDYITIAPSPVGEACAQVGAEGYDARSWAECKAFIAQLERQFGPSPIGARLHTKSFAHDFGRYREVVVTYNDQSPEAVEYASRLEAETPELWDEQARVELAEAGFPVPVV